MDARCLTRWSAAILPALLSAAAGMLNGADRGAAPMTPVGAAKTDITPEWPVRMYGYGFRKTESEGVAGRLKASALAIGGDGGAGPAVLLTVDNGAVPPPLRDEVLRRVRAKAALRPERFMLCNAHIHSGPDLYGMPALSGDEHARVARYAEQLTARLAQVVLEALESRRMGRLAWTRGTVGFAANRRVLKDGRWSGFGAVPDGPVDHSLPLLRVTDEEGRLLAVVINYACHNTTLRGDFKQIHADWAGCAQEFIENDHPGVVAMVTLGCGADADPCPHGTVDLCRRHGRAMADEVKRLLAGPFKPVDPNVVARMEVLEIPFQAPPPVEEIRLAAEKSYPLKRVLASLEKGEKPPTAEPYQLAVWSFGDDLTMVFLSGEVVVDYAARLKRELDGERLWVNAYANDVAYYVVSERLVREGGYEVNSSLNALLTWGRPETLRPPLEDRIVEAVRSLLAK